MRPHTSQSLHSEIPHSVGKIGDRLGIRDGIGSGLEGLEIRIRIGLKDQKRSF
jgi:hypothetical protein